MHLHNTIILFIIFEYISKIMTQGIPISPCPKMFQYRFDGSEWFGLLSVRSADVVQALHLQVTLSMKGKPTTNYLGEIELLTRGQYSSDTPILYKIKFPKNHFPPKLFQISVNNQVVCLGTADRSIFVTQIQLEHTRKLKFLTGDIPPPSSLSLSPTMGMEGGYPAPISTLPITTGLKESLLLPTNIDFGNKHLSPTNAEKDLLHPSKDICGIIDDRIRFPILQALKETPVASVSGSFLPATAFKNDETITASILMSNLSSRQDDETSKENDKTSTFDISRQKVKEKDNDRNNEDDGDHQDPLIVSDTDSNSDFMSVDGGVSKTINDLPSITRGTWPWLAAVYVNNLTSLAYQCGGTLISTRVVISAAHCFQLFKKRYVANEVLVFLGRHNLNNWNEEGSLAAPVADIFTHTDYNIHLNSYDADIAVVVLKNAVQFSTFIRPACLWTGPTDTKFIESQHGIVVGWSLGGYNNSKLASTTSTVPKIVSTPIVTSDVCFKANPKYHSLSSNRTFCAGIMSQDFRDSVQSANSSFNDKPTSLLHELHHGPCTGDSGSGLMIFKNKRWILRGIVSGSLPQQLPIASNKTTTNSIVSCSTNQYVIYTDVAKFLDWILSFIL